MKSRLIVVAVIKRGNKILFGKKVANVGPYPNTWHLPGGGINIEKEVADKAIEREIMEETGIEIRDLKKVTWNDDVEFDKNGEETYYVFLEYECHYRRGGVKPGDDIQQLEWIDIVELPKLDLNKPARELLNKLEYS